MKAYWDDFIATRGPEAVAKQLLQDAAQLDKGEMPSQLALHTPSPSTKEALQIANHMTPSPDLHPELKQFLYERIRTRLIEGLEDGELIQEPPLPADGYLIPADFTVTEQPSRASRKELRKLQRPSPDVREPTREEAEVALKVLRFLDIEAGKTGSQDSVQKTINLLENHFQLEPGLEKGKAKDVSVRWNDEVKKYHVHRPPVRLRVCYICRQLLLEPHPRYRSMCRPCGSFNLAGAALSLPESLNLTGRTALVTGARVNLGYHTCLRLLRCGATVIATTRYPNDAAVRYSQQLDFEDWKGRLKVIGADFRTARDAFALVKAVKSTLLEEWGLTTLDILINNAAQTLTDSVKKEERAIVREHQQSQAAADTNVLFQRPGHAQYQPRVRGGAGRLALNEVDTDEQQAPQNTKHIATIPAPTQDSGSSPEIILPSTVKDDGRTEPTTELQPYFKSSWVQTLAEIPYEDIVSAHAVNAFVPLILCRELLTLMGSEKKHKTPTSPSQPEPEPTSQQGYKRPKGYIINVSSREGIFENNATSKAKAGIHVHTNMTKAAVNMITATEAAAAWRERGVAMNTVDPGFMSTAPEVDAMLAARPDLGDVPLGWEDGAGRVLWPIAVGEVERMAVWGRFLKHYGAVGVDVSV